MADTALAEPSSAPISNTPPEEGAPPQEGEQQLQPAKKTKLIRRKKRPARVQVDPSFVKNLQPQQESGTMFNIWYSKYEGGNRGENNQSNTPAPGRCNLAQDSGYTRADRVNGSFFCLHFARGTCPNGAECQYLHRAPTVMDIFNPNIDCFGRDKHSDYRDDMGGVGSFMRQNRTLYVGRIHVTDDIEEVVSRHFSPWGQIERTRVLTGRGVAFVTYTNESNAQFAKEAMSNQSLDHEEVLNVRWATVDPNPMAQKRDARRLEEQAAEAVRRALPEAFVAEIEGRDPDAKKRKKIEGSFGLQGYDVPDDVWHARNRQLEDAKAAAGQLEAPEQPLMIEDAGQQTGRPEPESQSDGIFSSSAVAALRGLAGGTVTTQAAPKSAGGPLVAYGSDDESD